MKRFPLCFALCACTPMPHIHVEGFPELPTKVYRVENGEVFKYCAPALGGTLKGLATLPLGCALLNLEKNVCVVIVGKDSTPATLKHELMHCNGWWHDQGLQRYYDTWKASAVPVVPD